MFAEQEKKVGGKTIREGGTFKDEMNLVRGYWEAKDTSDKLEAEIEKKCMPTTLSRIAATECSRG